MRPFTIIDGRRRERKASRRFFRHPQTTSAPRSTASTIAGMSRGSFCRSPSDVTMIRPRAWSNPAAKAAVCPKFLRKRMTVSCGSTACNRASVSKLSSVLPSSMTMSSYERAHARSVLDSSACNSSSDAASFRTGITTDRSTIGMILSGFAASGFAPEHISSKSGYQDAHEGQRRLGPVLGHISAGPAAVPDRQIPERDVADGAPNRDRGRKSDRADADDGGEPDEDLERRGPRQQRWHEDSDDAVALQRRHRAFDSLTREALPDQRLAALPTDRVHHQAASQRAADCGDDIPRDEFLVSRSHHDQQQIGDAGQRKERRIEERDEEQPRRTERQRERADAADDSPHRMRS